MIRHGLLLSAPELFKQLCRYGAVGGVATLVHYVIFLSALPWLHPVGSSVMGACAGALIAYPLQRWFTFGDQPGRRLRAGRYFAVAAAYNVCNACALWLLLASDIQPVIAQMLITALLFLSSFFIHRFWSCTSYV